MCSRPIPNEFPKTNSNRRRFRVSAPPPPSPFVLLRVPSPRPPPSPPSPAPPRPALEVRTRPRDPLDDVPEHLEPVVLGDRRNITRASSAALRFSSARTRPPRAPAREVRLDRPSLCTAGPELRRPRSFTAAISAPSTHSGSVGAPGPAVPGAILSNRSSRHKSKSRHSPPATLRRGEHERRLWNSPGRTRARGASAFLRRSVTEHHGACPENTARRLVFASRQPRRRGGARRGEDVA